MGLLDGTDKQYYQGNDFGNYQFTSLEDIINQFMVVYTGDNKLIKKASRIDVAFHAQRALAELSFDTFKSVKSQQITLPPTLVMPLPRDYVNYTKLSWSDSAGIKHPLYPTGATSNPFQIRQEDDGNYSFPGSYELLINHNFAHTLTFTHWHKNSDDIYPLGANSNPSLGVEDGVLKFRYITFSGQGANNWGHVMALYQEIDTRDLSYLDISANATAVTLTEGVGTIRFGLMSSIPSDNIRNNRGTTSAAYPISPNVNRDVFDILDEDGEDGYLEWTEAATGEKSKAALDVRNYDKVYAVIISYHDFTTALSAATTTNSIDDLSVKNHLATNDLQPKVGNETESSTWNNYKSTTPSENQDDYMDDTYWPMDGERYGLDPQYAQANGSFYIDQILGRIHFSSNISGKDVILDYISDSLGTDEEMQVHKFAEEAMYKCIAHAILSGSSYGQQLVPRLTKEKFAAIRKAKLRLSNIKLEELTQILRGKSKQIKH